MVTFVTPPNLNFGRRRRQVQVNFLLTEPMNIVDGRKPIQPMEPISTEHRAQRPHPNLTP